MALVAFAIAAVDLELALFALVRFGRCLPSAYAAAGTRQATNRLSRQAARPVPPFQASDARPVHRFGGLQDRDIPLPLARPLRLHVDSRRPCPYRTNGSKDQRFGDAARFQLHEMDAQAYDRTGSEANAGLSVKMFGTISFDAGLYRTQIIAISGIGFFF
jgi:hypothetical protein